MEKIVAYKGFNHDLKCRNFQYEVGKTYELAEGEKPTVCEFGFHACENPFEVIDYYGDIVNNRYCVVAQSGSLDKRGGKTASSRIKIKAEIGFMGLFKAGIEWLKKATKDAPNNDNGRTFAKIVSSDRCAKIRSYGKYAQIGSSDDCAQIWSGGRCSQIGSSGDCAQIGSSGEHAKIASSGNYARIGSSGKSANVASSGSSVQIASSGDSSQIVSSGNRAQIGSNGEDSVICCTGHGSMAKAMKGSWITLAEWEYSKEKDQVIPKCVKTEYVDGERIKADTWYRLINGEFVEQ